jgi:hypothetical protein
MVIRPFWRPAQPDNPAMQMRSMLAALAVGLAACSPTLDWREVRPEGSGAQVLFPCPPSSHARLVTMAGAQVRLTLYACSAGGATWGVAFADVGEPARVAATLQSLRESARSNVDGAQVAAAPITVSGATPFADAGRLRIEGRLADGKPVQEQVAVFARGTVVYQATAVGGKLDNEHVEMFFAGLRLPG